MAIFIFILIFVILVDKIGYDMHDEPPTNQHDRFIEGKYIII